MENLLDIDLISFAKTKTNSKVTTNYLMTHKSKRIKFNLKSVAIPFGFEKFNGHVILNAEINLKKNNDNYNAYATISAFESSLKNLQTYDKCPTNLSSDINGKGYYPNLRQSEYGYIVRMYVIGSPKIYTILSGCEVTMTTNDIKKTIADIEMELGIIWITDNNYGYLWFLKEIHVLSSY